MNVIGGLDLSTQIYLFSQKLIDQGIAITEALWHITSTCYKFLIQIKYGFVCSTYQNQQPSLLLCCSGIPHNW